MLQRIMNFLKELLLFSISFLSFCGLFGQADSIVVDSSYTNISPAEVQALNALRINSPAHNLDLSNLRPRQKMKLVRQLQKKEASIRETYIKTVYKTIFKTRKIDLEYMRKMQQDSMKHAEAIIKLQRKIAQDSLDHSEAMEQYKTRQLRIEKRVSSLYGWISFSVLINLVFLGISLRKMFR